MTRQVRLQELLIGVEGLALLRHLYDGPTDDADRRLAEVRRILDDPSLAQSEVVAEVDPRVGYAAWSDNYDQPGNIVIGLEQPVVWSMLDALPVGRAVDLACGTGRHARHLHDLGHRVTGVDASPEMLGHAAARVPAVDLVQGDLEAVPLSDACADTVVCALAVAHLAALAPVMGELARVLAPGGTAVVSVLHPFQTHLGWHAPFEDAEGRRAFVREHAHTHADYLAAFRAAGLAVTDCVEVELTPEHAPAKRRAYRHVPEATAAAYVGLPVVLVWQLRPIPSLR